MKRTSLTRRLLAGAVGLMVGVAGTVALASPAYAAYGGGKKGLYVDVSGEAECDPETGIWTVTWTVTNPSKRVQATIVDPGDEVEDFSDNHVIPPTASVEGSQTFEDGTEAAELTIELKWAWEKRGRWIVVHKTGTATVELGSCKEDDDEDDGPPDDPTDPDVEVDVDFVRIVTCDFYVFMVRNNTEAEGGVTMALTPSVDAVHGHAPEFLPFLDEEAGEDGEIDIPEVIGLEIVGEVSGGETVGPLGPFGTGAAHAHGFEADDDLVVAVVIAFEGDTVVEGEFSWSEESAGLDCEEDGEGGELPVTGASTGLIALGALVLLALGGGLFLVARRRRVTFTA